MCVEEGLARDWPVLSVSCGVCGQQRQPKSWGEFYSDLATSTLGSWQDPQHKQVLCHLRSRTQG